MALPLGTHTLDLATGQPPRRSFRHLWILDLPPVGSTQTLGLAPQTALQAEFLSLTFNALAVGAVVPASRTNQGDGVRVNLDLPLRLHRVVFAAGVTGTITVHRVDGSAIAEQPTTSATILSGQITLSQEFSDRQFVLKRQDSTLTTGNITELWLISYPTTPRFGFLDERQSPAPLIPLWQAAGQLTTSNTQSRLTLAAQDFQPLERFLVGQSLPALQFVAESDAPCRVQITSTDLNYRISYQGFAPNALAPAKQVLRFQSSDLRPQSLDLTLPPQVQVASLDMSLSLTGSQQPVDPLATTPQAPPTQRQGIELLPQQWGGLPFTPAEATRYSGVTLGLLLLRWRESLPERESRTTLTVDLRTDADGLPGASLAQMSQTVPSASQPQWMTVRFAEPVVLYSQPYWLLVGASEPALWLTQPGEGDVYRLDRPPQTLWITRQHYANLQPLYQFLVPALLPAAKESAAPSIHPALSLQIANVTLPVICETDPNHARVNLMPGLPTANVSSAVVLTLSTTTAGIITVYAPEITYTPEQ